MALGVAGLLADGETIVQGSEAAVVSYPTFWDHLQRLASVRE
jgi:3-phosphoshikimate 1-carboxyvinyltransferase